MRLKIRKKTKQLKPKRSMEWPWQGSYWIALGAIAAYGATGGALTPKIYAQDTGSRSPGNSSNTAQTLPVRRFDIAAGPLDYVVEQYRSATGMHVRFSTPEVGRVQSPGVTGLHTDQEALNRILWNTGIEAHSLGRRSYELRPRQQNTRVEVTDEVAPLSSAKYTEPLRDIRKPST